MFTHILYYIIEHKVIITTSRPSNGVLAYFTVVNFALYLIDKFILSKI